MAASLILLWLDSSVESELLAILMTHDHHASYLCVLRREVDALEAGKDGRITKVNRCRAEEKNLVFA